MFKAVFFDWFNTLAIYYPPREELQSQAIREFGFDVSAEQVKPALLQADKLVFDENAKYPMRLRSKEEQIEVYVQYEILLMKNIVPFSKILAFVSISDSARETVDTSGSLRKPINLKMRGSSR